MAACDAIPVLDLNTPQDELVAALRQVDGATIEALTELTGWLPHTTRAALCRLRQRGLAITRNRVEGTTLYHLLQSGSLG